MKNPIDDVADAVKKTVDDARDGLNEARHRGEADLEREHRESEGDSMTAGDKAGSLAKEVKERMLSEVDGAKRKLRDAT